jgi:predicted deacylase
MAMPLSAKKKLRAAVAGILFQEVLLSEFDGFERESQAIDEVLDLHTGLSTSRYLNSRKKKKRASATRHEALHMEESVFY